MNSSDITPEKPEPIALVDMDGTLADFSRGMREAMEKLEGPNESWDYHDYDQDTEPPFMRARRRLVKSRPGFWSELPRFQLGFDVTEILIKLDFDITIFTKAPRTQIAAYSEKALWCREHLDFPHQISMVQDKGHHYGKVLVDDWPLYIKRWLMHRPRGTVIMPAHKYNANFQDPQVYRYTGTPESREEVVRILTAARRECQP